ncbi:MAG TPA: AAA family ATPase, partial [Pirellulales bacterium]
RNESREDGMLGLQDRSPFLNVTVADANEPVQIKFRIRIKTKPVVVAFQWNAKNEIHRHLQHETSAEDGKLALKWLGRMQTFALNPQVIGNPMPVTSTPMSSSGEGLAAVLDDLRDDKERWESLLAEMCNWLPEYDHIEFDKPQPGQKSVVLRTRKGHHRIPASQLSQGTLIALALLALAYSPNPPSLIGLEEIDRGLHPRLLRHLQDALYRLSYPESCGEKRPPIQVIATTHSPYLLDLYRDHPEEIVLAQKEGLEVKFNRLKDVEHFDDILGDSPLSEVWYSGVLGGVAVKP